MSCRAACPLAELVYLRVSQINNCAYWLDMHTRDLTKTGLPIEKLALGRRRQSLYRHRARRPGLGRDGDTCGPTGVPDEACQARFSARRNWSTSRSRQLDERLQSDGDQLPPHAPGGNQQLSEAHRPRGADTWKESSHENLRCWRHRSARPSPGTRYGITPRGERQ